MLREPNASKPTPIIGIIRFNNDRIKISTKFKISPNHWDEGRQRVKSGIATDERESINAYLSNLETAVATILAKLKTQRLQPTKELVRSQVDTYLNPPVIASKPTLLSFIDQFIEDAPTRINIETGKRINNRTIQKYKTTVAVLRDFDKIWRKSVDFDTINLDFYNGFVTYLTKKKGLAVNSVGKYIQTLKVFLNEATAQKVNNNLEFKSSKFKVLKEEADSVYLNKVELNSLYTLDLTKNSRLERVRDLFLVGCHTGLRFSDFTEIKPEFIKDGYIRMEQFKTMGRVVIPCHPIVTALLNKYAGQLPRSISNQKMNDYIKEVCQLAGIDQLEKKAITKGGSRVVKTEQKWKLVSTHTARRSFATNAYLLGIPTITIMRITGHKTEKAFMKYIKLNEEEHARIFERYWRSSIKSE